jgi:hypothetical protein
MSSPHHIFRVEPDGSAETGVCPCCGHVSRTVWGYVWRHDHPYATYFVHWAIGHFREHDAHWTVIVGQWGDGTGPTDRGLVRLRHRLLETGPAFIVIDAERGEHHTIAAYAFTRAEVVGTELAEDVFAICDAVCLHDARVAALAAEA